MQEVWWITSPQEVPSLWKGVPEVQVQRTLCQVLQNQDRRIPREEDRRSFQEEDTEDFSQKKRKNEAE